MLAGVVLVVVDAVLGCIDALQQTGIALALGCVVIVIQCDVFRILHTLTVVETGKSAA